MKYNRKYNRIRDRKGQCALVPHKELQHVRVVCRGRYWYVQE